jgi:amino acid permease
MAPPCPQANPLPSISLPPFHHQVIIAVIGVTFLLPLCFIKRIGALSALSSVAVVGFLYTSVVVLRNAFLVMSERSGERKSPWEGVELIKFDFGALFALPIVVFGFNCHANSVSHVIRALLTELFSTTERREGEGGLRVSMSVYECP